MTPARSVRRRLTYNTPARAAATPNMRTGGFRNKETKFVDSYHSVVCPKTIATSIVDPSTNQNLFGLSVNSDQSGRIGRCSYLKSIYIQGHLNIPIATSHNATNYYVTLWLVEDKQTNKALMSPTDFLTSLNSKTDADAFQNLQYSDRFRLLSKKTIRFNKYATGTCGGDVPFKIYKKYAAKVQYSGTGATIGAVTTSSFHLLAISSEETTSAMEITYQARCRYTD